ncbi:hypothetical protein L2E82_05927 [Cichorium intybus]|uniref:Uncharacterized protein n=1 Tax=Cichorium intybus TaxID=13427 RepID=A0ACB9H9D8_CICIN|nr:hypothetical protein L2E82_05927 [Cichorium intybus]
MQIFRSISSCVCNIIEFMGRCLGCYTTKSSFVTTHNNNQTGKSQDTNNNRPSILEDFYSSSTYDMESTLSQYQITASSTTNLPFDTQSTSSTNPSQFTNHGFLLWNQTRQQWIGDKPREQNKKPREPVISWAIRWNATYDNLLGTNKPFARPIPLPEMVNFLVDIWEQEGLYD